jgi:hypothetical protein
MVVEPGMHRAWELLQPYRTLHVPPQLALLYHYRQVIDKDHVPAPHEIVIDDAARNVSRKFDIELAVQGKVSAFKGHCEL